MADRPTTGITPFLTVRDRRGHEALDFYKTAFAAKVIETNIAQDGERLMQAGLTINGGWLMLSDEFPNMTAITIQRQAGRCCIFRSTMPMHGLRAQSRRGRRRRCRSPTSSGAIVTDRSAIRSASRGR